MSGSICRDDDDLNGDDNIKLEDARWGTAC